MKHFVKILALGAALTASASIAHATSISGTIGFGGNGTYNNTTGQFAAGANIGSTGGNAYVNTSPNTGSMTMFTIFNPATFYSFSTTTIGAGEPVFTVSEAGTTLSFTLTGLTTSDAGTAGPEFTGTGILSETGFTNTAATFSLSTNAGAQTFITFNTAAAAATPEPSSLMLLGTGLVSAAGMLVRRRRITA